MDGTLIAHCGTEKIGREQLALRAAATLLRGAPDRLWRRCACIAAEDVGLASLEAMGITTAALAGKRYRADLGGEWIVACCIISELCRAPKCRASDDLLMSAALHPDHAQARADLAHLSTSELIDITIGNGSIHDRALALWCGLGTDRRSPGLKPRRGKPQLVFDALCEAGWPHSLVEIARESYRRTGVVLGPLVALLSREFSDDAIIRRDDIPPETMIGELPSWALDLYSREGKAALARFLQTDARSLDGFVAK